MFYEKLLITALAFWSPVQSQGSTSNIITTAIDTEMQPWTSMAAGQQVIAPYQQTCLQTWTQVPSSNYDASKLKLMRDYSSNTAWYNQHNMQEISWKMFTDLYETPDQTAWNFQNNMDIKQYLSDIYSERLQDASFVQSIAQGKLWELTSVETVKEAKHWITKSEQRKFSGMTGTNSYFTNGSFKNSPNEVYHGYNDNGKNTVKFSNRINTIDYVRVIVGVEHYDWVEDYVRDFQNSATEKVSIRLSSAGAPITYEGQTWWAELTHTKTEANGVTTTEVFYLDNTYHRVFAVCARGFDTNGLAFEDCIGDEDPTANNQLVVTSSKTYDQRISNVESFTYDLGKDDRYQLLGFQSWFTQQKDNSEKNTGFSTKTTTNVVGWLGLVVMDNSCLTCGTFPTAAPTPRIQQGATWNQFYVTWSNVGYSSDYGLIIRYGTSANNLRYSSEVNLSKQRVDLTVPADVAAGSYLYFEVAFRTSCEHTKGVPLSAYLIPDLSVGCARITAVLSETSNTATFSFVDDSASANKPTSYEFWQRVGGIETKIGTVSATQNNYQFTAIGLRGGSTYEFQVRPVGVNGAATGCSWFSKSMAVALTCPNYLTIDGISSGCDGFMLQWQTDYTSNNKKFLSYELQYAIGFVENWQTIQTSTTIMEKFVTGLNGQLISGDLGYRFRVIGKPDGCDPFISSPTNLLQLKSATAPYLSFGQADCSSLGISWTGGSGIASDWQLQYQELNGNTWKNLLTGQSASYKFTEGIPGTLYNFRLVPSATSTLKSCGGAVASASEVIQGSIASSVTPVINFVNSECDGITIYFNQGASNIKVYYRDLSAGAAWKEAVLSAGGQTNINSVKVLLIDNINLVTGREYYFKIATINGFCGDAESNEYKAFVMQQQKPFFRTSATCNSIDFYGIVGLPTLTLEQKTNSGWSTVSNWKQQSGVSTLSLTNVNGSPIVPGNFYTFRLQSNSLQCGASTSDMQSVYVPAIYKPTFTTDFDCDSITISYSGYGNLQLQYRISSSGNEFKNVADWSPSTSGFVTIKRLSATEVVSSGKSYDFKITQASANVCAKDSDIQQVSIPASSSPTLQVKNQGCSSVQLDWTIGQGASNYRIDWISDSGLSTQIPTPSFESGILTTTTNQVGNSMILSGNRYKFRISQQGTCASATAEAEVVMPSGTSAPSIAVTNKCSTATVTWPTGTYGTLRLQQSTNGQTWTPVNTVITGNSVDVPDLTSGLTHWFRFENVDSICSTTYSEAVKLPIGSTAAAPYVYATTPTCNTIQLTWSNVASNDDFSIEFLSREASNSGPEVWTDVLTKKQLPQGSTNTYSLTQLGGQSLISGRMYTFRMILKTACDTIYSRENAFVTMQRAIAPTLSASGTCGNQKIFWQGGSNLAGQTIQMYYTTAGNQNNWQVFPNFVSSANSLSLSDSGVQFQNTAYLFKLSTTGSCGLAESNVQSVSFEGVAPAPTDLTFTVQGTQACIKWTQPSTSATISEYFIEYQSNGGIWQQLGQNCPVTSSQLCCFQTSLFTNANFGTSSSCADVGVRMAAVSSCGQSGYSMRATYSTSTLPNAPIDVQRAIGEYSNNKITVRWSEPEFDGCSPITHYKVYFSELPCVNFWTNAIYSFYPEFDWVIASSSVQPSEMKFQLNSGVYQGERYAFSVEACNFNGCSSKSHAFTTVALNPPSQPLNGKATALGSDLMQISWDKPLDNWNTITSYRVEINEKMVNDARCFFQNAQATQCVLLLDSIRKAPFFVQPDTDFNIRVYALSHQGSSDASDTFSATMTAEECDEQIQFAAVKDISFGSETEVTETNDLLIFNGLDKGANTETAEEPATNDERVNLAARNHAFMNTEETNQEKSAALFTLGVACTLLAQLVLCGGYYIYSRRKREAEPEIPELASEEATVNHSTATLAREADTELAGIAV